MPSRASDQWFKREDVVLEAAEVSIGLVTVANEITLDAGASYIGLATVDVGSAIPAGEAFIGLATVTQGGTVNTQEANYSFKYFANANTSLATTFAVKGSAAVLHTITAGGVSNPTIGIFDDAAAASTPVYIIRPGTAAQTYVFDESLSNGLVVEYGEGETAPMNISYT